MLILQYGLTILTVVPKMPKKKRAQPLTRPFGTDKVEYEGL